MREHVALAGEIPSPLNPPSGCVFHTRCPIAMEKCSSAVPPLARLGGHHAAACFAVQAQQDDPGNTANKS